MIDKDNSVKMGHEPSRDGLIGSYIENRYRIESLLGKGASAAVYKAFDEKVGRMVAVKLPKVSGVYAEESKQSFEKEATRYIRLQHPNTLRLFDYGQTEQGQTFIVTELLEGETLSERLERFEAEGRIGIGPRQTLTLLKDVASALSEAHAVGLVHRDLKPSNIFLQTLGGQEVVKVIDFGISKDLQEMTMTGSSNLWGTPLYMSPEQAHGRSVDARSDLYTLGVIAFECLTGKTPFSGSTPYAILMQHIDSQPPTLRDAGFSGSLPQGYEAMVFRLLEKDPADRTRSSDALIAELQLIEDLWSSVRLTGTNLQMDTVPVRKRSYFVAVGLGVILSLLLFTFVKEETSSSQQSAVSKDDKSTSELTKPSKPIAMETSTSASTKVAAGEGITKSADMVAAVDKNTVKPAKADDLKTDVTLEIRTSPPGAVLMVDGQRVGLTPFTGTLKKVEQTRELTVSLPGYMAKQITLDPNATLLVKELTLSRARKQKRRTKKRKGSPFEIKAQ
ncbi:MAG: protein kinase domain-containing protein [Bradymonadia bacterium]